MRIPVILCMLLLFAFFSCQKDNEAISLIDDDQVLDLRSRPLGDQASITILVDLTVDAEGNKVIPTAVDPATLLFYRRTGLPVFTPDGHQITAGEFSAGKGTAEAKCIEGGTQINLKLRDLVPNATYRVWLLTFKAPGFDLGLPNPFVNLIGSGAVGPNDRSRNTFKSSASGQGTLVRFIPEGSLSEFGSVEGCLLSEVFEWHIVAAFQQPGQPYGPEIGPPAVFPTSAVEQFGFIFK